MIIQPIKMAWKAIVANKMRSFLTMLGIIIGVLSLVVLVSLVTSATSSVSDQISAMGNDMLTVNIMDDKGNPLKSDDLIEISDSDSIALVAPTMQISGTAKHGSETTSVSMEGTNGSYFIIEGSELAAGRFLKNADLDNGSYVAVLSYDAADSIYGSTNVVGENLQINGIKFLVVGVLAEEESMMSGMFSSNSVYIPFTLAERLSDNGSAITSFYATATDADNIDRAETVLTNNLLSRFKNDSDAFNIRNMSTLSDTMSSVTNTFALLLGGIAAISLLVGGIGIMNIMLVSVTERTREIGIRKAIGAKRFSILLQFLIESLVICLIGCAIGILLSAGILAIVNTVTDDMTFTMSGVILLVAVLFSTFIGLVFGVYPARKASKMNPIDALRFE
jgi:putative ABC transport system permease protein